MPRPENFSTATRPPQHPRLNRRVALQAGAIGLVGLGMNHLEALRAAPAAGPDSAAAGRGRARAAIYIFLSGGLAQLDSFDLKPAAPADIRGEFQPIATNTPGIQICEHLPQLAQRSHLWALCRSLSHPSNNHSAGHHIMLTGRSELPAGFNPSVPMPSDWPAIAAVAGAVTQPRNNLPPAVILPEKLIHNTRRVIPGQFGGIMGPRRDPWFIDASPFSSLAYGAYPQYEFDHQIRANMPRREAFQAPNLALPEGFASSRLDMRLELLRSIDRQPRRSRTVRYHRAIRPLSRGGHFAAHRQARSRSDRRHRRATPRPKSAMAKTRSAGRCSWPAGWSKRASISCK